MFRPNSFAQKFHSPFLELANSILHLNEILKLIEPITKTPIESRGTTPFVMLDFAATIKLPIGPNKLLYLCRDHIIHINEYLQYINTALHAGEGDLTKDDLTLKEASDMNQLLITLINQNFIKALNQLQTYTPLLYADSEKNEILEFLTNAKSTAITTQKACLAQLLPLVLKKQTEATSVVTSTTTTVTNLFSAAEKPSITVVSPMLTIHEDGVSRDAVHSKEVTESITKASSVEDILNQNEIIINNLAKRSSTRDIAKQHLYIKENIHAIASSAISLIKYLSDIPIAAIAHIAPKTFETLLISQLNFLTLDTTQRIKKLIEAILQAREHDALTVEDIDALNLETLSYIHIKYIGLLSQLEALFAHAEPKHSSFIKQLKFVTSFNDNATVKEYIQFISFQQQTIYHALRSNKAAIDELAKQYAELEASKEAERTAILNELIADLSGDGAKERAKVKARVTASREAATCARPTDERAIILTATAPAFTPTFDAAPTTVTPLPFKTPSELAQEFAEQILQREIANNRLTLESFNALGHALSLATTEFNPIVTTKCHLHYADYYFMIANSQLRYDYNIAMGNYHLAAVAIREAANCLQALATSAPCGSQLSILNQNISMVLEKIDLIIEQERARLTQQVEEHEQFKAAAKARGAWKKEPNKDGIITISRESQIAHFAKHALTNLIPPIKISLEQAYMTIHTNARRTTTEPR